MPGGTFSLSLILAAMRQPFLAFQNCAEIAHVGHRHLAFVPIGDIPITGKLG
jgi:hypothetical protein